MAGPTSGNGKRATDRSRSTDKVQWTESLLHQAVEQIQQQAGNQQGSASTDRRAREAIDEIVQLGMQPEILAALQKRRDPEEAVRDLVTRYAFEALIVQGQAFGDLDPLSQAMVERTLDVIYKRASQVEQRTGENPLDEDEGLLYSICKSLSRYVPRKPIGGHISWKLNHYESAVSRAMRQIENLVCHPQVTEGFVAFVVASVVRSQELRTRLGPEQFKAYLLQMARGGGRRGVPYEATIRFFARPEAVAFVKRFAGTVQTARTLYAEELYHDVPWQGRRRLPINRRQGYLETALARIEQKDHASLDTEEIDLHAVVGDPKGWPGQEVPPSGSFAHWVTRCALEARPGDALWRAAELLYVQALPLEEIVASGLADRDTLAAARERMEALRSDPEIRQIWRAAHG